MGKIIGTVLGSLLLIVVGFMVFDGDDANIARDANATTENANLNGIGGPEEGVTGFEDWTDESYFGEGK